MGMIVYGKYFLTAHIVQQAANDAARAAIAGLDQGEREVIARRAVDSALTAGGVLQAGRASVSSDEHDGMMIVSVEYDISRDPLIHLPMVPSPGNSVVSQAAVMVSGL